MFRFAHTIYLYLLILIPLLSIGYVWICRSQKKRLQQYGALELMFQLSPMRSQIRRHVKFALMMFILALISIVLARPQFGSRTEQYKRSGIEAIIAMDVSNSMLCRDVSPSRLDKSKMLVSKLIDQLDEDKLGLVAFAGTAITILPITNDNVSAKMFLDQIGTNTVSVQGTNTAEAIQRATACFSDNEAVGKALILITDAEDHEDGAIEAAQNAEEKGIKVIVLSVGTKAGGPIPMNDGSYKKDKNGNVVTTALNEQIGQEIAQAGNGLYIHVGQSEQAQDALEAEIDKMQKAEFSSELFSDYDEQFVAVGIILIFAIVAEVCISEARNPLLSRIKLFK